MNAERRKRIEQLWSTVDSAKSELETIRDDEQAAYDNMPESLQDGERWQKMSESIDLLEEAISNIGEATESLTQIQSL